MNIRQEIHDLWEQRMQFKCIDIRCYGRVCLSRNISGFPFSFQASAHQRFEVLEKIKKALTNVLNLSTEWFEIALASCNPVEGILLRSLCRLENPCDETVVWVNRKNFVQIIANDGDHCRLQYISSFLTYKELWSVIDALDTQLETQLDYAFDPELGYYTCSPSYLGTGLLTEGLLHLPGLCFFRQINHVQEALKELQLKFKIAKRVKDEYLAHFFYISNTFGRGCDEITLLNHFENANQLIIQKEEEAREVIKTKHATFIRDSVSRAWGLLRHCYEISFEEAMNLLSVVAMAFRMGMFVGMDENSFMRLWQSMSTFGLKVTFQKEFKPEEENTVRADILRNYFSKISDPFIVRTEEGSHVS